MTSDETPDDVKVERDYPQTRKAEPDARGDDLERHVIDLLAEHLAAGVASIDGDAEARRITTVLRRGSHHERRKLISEHVRQVVIGDGELTIELADGPKLHRTIERVRHGNDATLLLSHSNDRTAPEADPQLLVLLRDAHRALALALAKPKLSLEQLAARFGRSSERYKRLLRLSYLSPRIIEAIAEGQQPARVTNRFLQNLDGIPVSWAEQERLLLS